MASWKILFLAFLLAGCGSSPPKVGDTDLTVKHHINEPKFQAENLPVRRVSVVAVIDRDMHEEEATSAIRGASRLFMAQVGVQLDILRIERVEWNSRDPHEVIDELLFYPEHDNDFDIIIGFTRQNSILHDRGAGVRYVARTVDWRYIHMPLPDPILLAHEIGHAFLRLCAHSDVGLMKASDMTPYLTPSDRERFLKQKQIDFRRPLLPEERC